MFNLTGKKALVTGASGGIGGAIAKALHAQGAEVGLSGRNVEALEKLAHLGFGQRARELINQFAVHESLDVGNATNAELLCQRLVFVGVDLGELELATVLCGELFQYRLQCAAWPAPFSPEIHQHRR